MPRYRVELRAVYEVEAANVAQAAREARALRTVGERSGCRRGPHDRDSVRHVIRRVEEQIGRPERIG